MKSAVTRNIVNAALLLSALSANLFPVASAQDGLAAEMKQMAMECRAARDECLRACNYPSRELERGREVANADIEACRNAHAMIEPPAAPEPTWAPVYAAMPDVVGVFRGALVQAQGRDDWKRYCRSSALIGDHQSPATLGIPKGATVRLSGVRYVTNPINSFDRSKTACRAEGIEVIATP